MALRWSAKGWPHVSILLVICTLLTLLGGFVTLMALFPKRRGDTPYCRKCGYNLTGLDLDEETARCPECGAMLSRAKAIVIGERNVRRLRLVIWLLFFLSGAAPLMAISVVALLKVDWYGFKPTILVLSDLESNNTPLAAQGWSEIRPPLVVRFIDRQAASPAGGDLSARASPQGTSVQHGLNRRWIHSTRSIEPMG